MRPGRESEAPRGRDASYATLAAAAIEVHDELRRWLAARNPSRRQPIVVAAAKHTAAVALTLERAHGIARPMALQVAADVAQASLRLSSGSVKKNRSEARAILDMLPEGHALPSAVQTADLGTVFEQVLAIPVGQARQQRAERLGGALGGRPSRATDGLVTDGCVALHLVRDLMARAAHDPDAAEELHRIRSVLSSSVVT